MAKKQRVRVAASSYAFDLVATKDFGEFKRGQVISDEETIATLLRDNAHDVTKVTKSL